MDGTNVKKHNYLPFTCLSRGCESVVRVQLETHACLRLLLESCFCSASPPVVSLPGKQRLCALRWVINGRQSRYGVRGE